MGKNKLLHFEENRSFPNVYQPTYAELEGGYRYGGRWADTVFHNNHPMVLELGCGKGEYTVGLARKHPDKNYVGIDKKGARMWRGAKTAVDENIRNAVFLRIKLEQMFLCFGPSEVEEIWITFPEPVPKVRRIKRRLTSPTFLETYRRIMTPGGIVHLKTDSDEFYHYSLDTVREAGFQIIFRTEDLYNSDFLGEVKTIRTYYERIHLKKGARIKYLQFQITPENT